MTLTPESSRIIVGVDGSQPSIEALTRAAHLADMLHAPLEAIRVWEYPVMYGAGYPNEWSPENDAQHALADAVDRAFDGAPPLGLTQTVLQGHAARVLIDESASAFMLVLGSRGHGGFERMLIGSVSAACAEHAQCPVLIMHTPKGATTS